MRANQEGWQERLQQALVKLPPTPLVRPPADARSVTSVSAVPGSAAKAAPGEAIVQGKGTSGAR